MGLKTKLFEAYIHMGICAILQNESDIPVKLHHTIIILTRHDKISNAFKKINIISQLTESHFSTYIDRK